MIEFPGWETAFHSGMSANNDLAGAITAGAPVGVVAGKIPMSKLFMGLPRYMDQGGKVFVDSGAFTAFSKGLPVDWAKVFRTYDTLIGATDAPGNLSIVAPDVVGDQSATLDIWGLFKPEIQRWIEAGARVIVPLQCGDLSAGQVLAKAVELLGTNQFCAGIPSNLAAMQAGDCATITHHDFHILGRVEMTKELGEKVHALLSNNPAARYTSDATWLRSRIALISKGDGPSENHLEPKRTRAIRQLLLEQGYPQLSHGASA